MRTVWRWSRSTKTVRLDDARRRHVKKGINVCTRVLYHGDGDRVLTGRSMDWKSELYTDLWVFPRGMERNGAAGSPEVTWTSKYGSVIASAYEVTSTDGINEKGLVANLLWLVESGYPVRRKDRPTMSISIWAQYVLDNFATVDEVVEQLARNEFDVATEAVPGEQRLATMHLSVSDPTGDSAIFEYIDGELRISHSRDYTVMTNSPTFPEQLAISSYWDDIGGTVMLPGTNRAADRFVRARFYIDAVPKTDDRRVALASVYSVVRNVSVPYGISTENEPNISSTRWRTVADQKDLVYYFEPTLSPGVFWARLSDFDLSEGAPTMKLNIADLQEQGISGNATDLFREAEPFVFLPALGNISE